MNETGLAGKLICISKKPASVVIALAILLQVCLSLYLSFRLNIWTDEAYSLATTGAGPVRALIGAVTFEMKAPLYFVLLGLWRLAFSSIMAARVLSTLFVAMTLVLILSTVNRYVTKTELSLMAIALAFHPYMIWAASEIRPFALVLMVGSGLQLLFLRGHVEQERAEGKYRWMYVALGAVALYSHYYLGFLLLGNGIALLAIREYRKFLRYVVDMFIVLAAFLPMALYLPYQMSGYGMNHDSSQSLKEGAYIVYKLVHQFLLPVNPGLQPMTETISDWSLRVVIVILPILVFIRLRTLKPANMAILISPAVVAACYLPMVLFTGKDLLQERHAVALFVPLISAAFVTAAAMVRKGGVAAWAAISLVFYIPYLFLQYAPMAKHGDSIRVAMYIMERERPGQAILFFPPEPVLPFKHYYRGENTVIALPGMPSLERYDVSSFVLHDEREIETALEGHDVDNGIWVVTKAYCGYLGVDFNCDLFENYLDEHYIVKTDHGFATRVQVRLLVPK